MLARRGVVANACLAVVLAAVLAAESWDLASEGRQVWLDCVTGAIVCTAAIARERGRGRAAATGLVVSAAAAVTAWLGNVPGEPEFAAMLALLVLLAAAVRVLPEVPAAAIVAGGAALGGLLAILHPDSGVGLPAAWWATGVAAGLLLRIRDARRQAGRDAVRRAERLELARELHDVAAHHMTGVVLQAQAARIVARKQPALLDEALRDIESAGTGALAAVRRVIGLLRDDGDAAGLAPAPEPLVDLVERFARNGIPVTLQLLGDSGDSSGIDSPEVTGTVYRVVTEALTNVARHAPAATEVTVIVSRGSRAVTVEVTDDAPASASLRIPDCGYGLVGMRERVEALGGTVTAGPRPAGGWSVRATVPVRRS
ncbi:MAG: sensor histidine kinase [Nocardiopsaceae bacterium]|nr:sensor histidine kinase [Nocardiopsaceae bacterium]